MFLIFVVSLSFRERFGNCHTCLQESESIEVRAEREYLLSLAKSFPMNFFCPMLTHYIEPLVPFTAWAKIYSSEYFCSTKVAELGGNFFFPVKRF